MTPRPPALVIEIPVEGKPVAYVTAQTSREADALREWLESREGDVREQVSEILDQVSLIRSRLWTK